MLLAAELRHRNWEVLGTDISSRVLETARRALYDMARTEGIPREYLQRYCMKGTGPYAGKLLIEQALRDHVQFAQLNLNEALPAVGQFDVILLRNVMIYFDADTKARVVERLLPCLKAGGHFLIGHCDSLQGMTHDLKPLQTAVFRKSAT
jgi:chemotaxis protein methyltransferase CheR